LESSRFFARRGNKPRLYGTRTNARGKLLTDLPNNLRAISAEPNPRERRDDPTGGIGFCDQRQGS
jgi:hypothetical protein